MFECVWDMDSKNGYFKNLTCPMTFFHDLGLFPLMFKHPLVHGLDMCRVTRQVAGSVHPVLTTILALLALGKPGTYTDTPFTRVCVCNALIR